MSVVKSRKKPSANFHETLVNSPYLGKAGSDGAKVRQGFPAAPSVSDMFRGFIDPKYAHPFGTTKKRSRQPSYRAPTFTSLNRKADISNALKSKTVQSPLQKPQHASPGFPAKRQKSVMDTNDSFSGETFTGFLESVSGRNKSLQRKRGDSKTTSGKGSSLSRTLDFAEDTAAMSAHDEARVKRPALKKKKLSSKAKTKEEITAEVPAAEFEIQDFLGSPSLKAGPQNNLNAGNDTKIKGSNADIKSLAEHSSILEASLIDTNYEDIFQAGIPSPKHEYPILEEVKTTETHSKEVAFVQNALATWMNYKDTVTPVVSKTTLSSPSQGETKKPGNSSAKRPATKTLKVVKKKKTSESTTVPAASPTKADSVLPKPVSRGEDSLTKTDFNGNERIDEFDLLIHTPITPEETAEEVLPNVETTAETELDSLPASQEVLKEIESKEPVAPLSYASTATQVRFSGTQVNIQVGESLTDVTKKEVITVEEDCQTELESPKAEEMDTTKECISAATQTNPPKRRKPTVPCPRRLKSRPSFGVPFPVEVETVVPETIPDSTEEAAVVAPPVEATSRPSRTNTMAKDINNNDIEVSPTEFQEEGIEGLDSSSLDLDGRPGEMTLGKVEEDSSIKGETSGTSFAYLNGQVSTVGCSAPASSGNKDLDREAKRAESEGRVSDVGYVKCYEPDTVPLIDACSCQDPTRHTVGVSGIPKTWSLTSYNHPFSHQCLGQPFAVSMSSIACDSPGYAASTQTLDESHALCQVGSSFKLYPLPEHIGRPKTPLRPKIEPSEDFLNPENLLKMSQDVRQAITDLDLGTNIGNTLDTITTTFRALSEIVSDLVTPDDETPEASSEEDTSARTGTERRVIVAPNETEKDTHPEPSQFVQILESVCDCTLDPTISEITY